MAVGVAKRVAGLLAETIDNAETSLTQRVTVGLRDCCGNRTSVDDEVMKWCHSNLSPWLYCPNTEQTFIRFGVESLPKYQYEKVPLLLKAYV